MVETSNRLKIAEFVLWVVVVTSLIVGSTVALGFALGDGLKTAKVLLFGIGFLLFGVGSLELRPKSAWREESRFSVDDGEHPLEERINEIPPLREADLPYKFRISRGAKFLVTSILVLAASFAMEAALGVGPT